MRWLADECVAGSLVAALRSDGHDVDYAAETAQRASDSELLTRAEGSRRLLLTEDKDFGDLVFRQSRVVPGVVLLRIDPLRPATRSKRLQAAIDNGIAGFVAYTSPGNRGMINLFKTLPYKVRNTLEGDMLELKCKFNEPAD